VYVDKLKYQVESMNNILLDAGYTGTVMDIDGNIYKTVKIGQQVWMAENLKTTTYVNGDTISDGTGAGDITIQTEPKYWFVNNDDLNNVSTYGRLYTSYTVTDSRNICPDGWHVPTDAEWTTLIDYISNSGFDGLEGRALKSTSGWQENGNGIDIYGFTALPGGSRDNIGNFSSVGSIGGWWSATENDTDTAWGRMMNYMINSVLKFSSPKWSGFSVRCVRDN
jgi:uncharacterized protein (TIGR02145 family)